MTGHSPSAETPSDASRSLGNSRTRRLFTLLSTARNRVIIAVGLVAVAALAVVLVALLNGGDQDQARVANLDAGTTLAAFATPAPFGAPAAGIPPFADQDEEAFSFAVAVEDAAADKSLRGDEPRAVAQQGGVGGGTSGQASGSGGVLSLAQRQVISQASLSIEVVVVADAVNQVRAIAEGLGGFVEQLSSSGVDKGQYSTLTIRVPQSEFFAAFDRIKLLGEVVNENAGSQDVTEQFIDLEARLKSAQREEESLLSLLGRAEKVSDVLTIERELFRVRTDLERLQGQLNFLERRVDLATITVSLFTPEVRHGEPSSASVVLEAKEVAGSVEDIKALITGAGGELDQVYTSVRDGLHRAQITARVFAADFERVLASVETHGRVTAKDVNEGSTAPGADDSTRDEPRSRITIELFEAEDQGAGKWLTVGAPIGGAASALLLAVLLYAAYRVGGRNRAAA